MSEDASRIEERGKKIGEMEEPATDAQTMSSDWQTPMSSAEVQVDSVATVGEGGNNVVEAVRDEILASEEDDSNSASDRDNSASGQSVPNAALPVVSQLTLPPTIGGVNGEKGGLLASPGSVPFTPLSFVPLQIAPLSPGSAAPPPMLVAAQTPRSPHIPSPAAVDEMDDAPPPSLSSVLSSAIHDAPSSSGDPEDDEDAPPRLPDLPDMPVFKPSAHSLHVDPSLTLMAQGVGSPRSPSSPTPAAVVRPHRFASVSTIVASQPIRDRTVSHSAAITKNNGVNIASAGGAAGPDGQPGQAALSSSPIAQSQVGAGTLRRSSSGAKKPAYNPETLPNGILYGDLYLSSPQIPLGGWLSVECSVIGSQLRWLCKEPMCYGAIELATLIKCSKTKPGVIEAITASAPPPEPTSARDTSDLVADIEDPLLALEESAINNDLSSPFTDVSPFDDVDTVIENVTSEASKLNINESTPSSAPAASAAVPIPSNSTPATSAEPTTPAQEPAPSIPAGPSVIAAFTIQTPADEIYTLGYTTQDNYTLWREAVEFHAPQVKKAPVSARGSASSSGSAASGILSSSPSSTSGTLRTSSSGRIGITPGAGAGSEASDSLVSIAAMHSTSGLVSTPDLSVDASTKRPSVLDRSHSVSESKSARRDSKGDSSKDLKDSKDAKDKESNYDSVAALSLIKHRLGDFAPWVSASAFNLIRLFFHGKYKFIKAIFAVIPATEADKVAGALARMFFYADIPLALVKSVIDWEVERTTVVNQLFRQDSIASKIMTAYTRLIAQPYLVATLKPHVAKIVKCGSELEINPEQLKEEEREFVGARVFQLQQLITDLLTTIKESTAQVPTECRLICNFLDSAVGGKFGDQKATEIALAGYLFLRLINPAIVVPDSMGIIDKNALTAEGRRSLLLVSKIVLNMANQVPFSKEPYLLTFNSFLNEKLPFIQSFIADCIQVSPDAALTVTDLPPPLLILDELALLYKLLYPLQEKLATALAPEANVLKRFRAAFSAIGAPPATAPPGSPAPGEKDSKKDKKDKKKDSAAPVCPLPPQLMHFASKSYMAHQ